MSRDNAVSKWDAESSYTLRVKKAGLGNPEMPTVNENI